MAAELLHTPLLYGTGCMQQCLPNAFLQLQVMVSYKQLPCTGGNAWTDPYGSRKA